MIDLILHNGQIGRHSALAIVGEQIVGLGSDEDILPLAGSKTKRINLGGRVVIAGLVDAHIHWENTAKARYALDLWNVPSLEEALARIREHLPLLGAGEWLTGSGWAQDVWADRAFPSRQDLDAITGQIPTYLTGKSGHVAWVNSAALQIAGQMADPEGGKILRDADGQPTGILFETPAMNLVKQHIPEPSPEKLSRWMQDLQAEAWRLGLTGFHDFDNPSCLFALQLLRERGDLGMRVLKQINAEWIHHAHELGLRSGFGDEWLRIGALKIFADGALGARTAAMLAPYESEANNYGVVVTDKAHIYEQVSLASRLGFASSIHAIGDAAVRDVLDVFEQVRREEFEALIPRSARRHRIEHVQIIHPDDRQRLGDLGIIASMQPIHAASDWQMADRWWGERARYSYAWRTQVQAGAVLAFGSDAPIDPFNPWMGLYAAITRQDLGGQPTGGWYPEEKLNLEEALHAYTQGAAYAAGLEKRLGKIEAGYLADLIVLDRHPSQIPPDEWLDLQVQGTMVGGVWRHRLFD